VGGSEALTQDEASRHAESAGRVLTELGRVVLGQDAVLREALLALLARGHVLLEGPPGTAKTLLVRALNETLGLVLTSPFESAALSNASLSLDYYHVKITDAIATVTAQSTFDLCFNRDGTSNPGYSIDDPNHICRNIVRDETSGAALQVLSQYENLGIIQTSQHDRLPVYRGDIDNIVGVTRVRDLLPELVRGELTQAILLERIREPNFVPEGTPLNKQLLNFQQTRRRSAFVVDEYGDVQGLITTQDILREIVGELASAGDIGVTKESDRSYVVDASANVRQLNRVMNWNLPTDGPKTLNGLIVEQLETIPESGTGVTVADYPIEILDASEHGIKTVRVFPPGSQSPPKVAA